jgi:hypothetical protein
MAAQDPRDRCHYGFVQSGRVTDSNKEIGAVTSLEHVFQPLALIITSIDLEGSIMSLVAHGSFCGLCRGNVLLT